MSDQKCGADSFVVSRFESELAKATEEIAERLTDRTFWLECKAGMRPASKVIERCWKRAVDQTAAS